MKSLLALLGLACVLSCSCFAQTVVDNTPASKEDIERYLAVMHSHDMMKKMSVTMSRLQQTLHHQYLKNQASLPPDYEAKMNEAMNQMFENMPWDEITQAMVPVYQKRLTRGDIDNLVAFYSSPTGEKLLRDMPAIMADSMTITMPIMLRYMETVKQTLLEKTDVMIAQSKKHPAAKSSMSPD